MNISIEAKLTSGDIKKMLFRLTVPMMFGMFGLIAFNLVDTYFVSRLGTNELAALTFTFPVVLVINSISLGIGTGTLSVLSRAIGKGDQSEIVRYATDSLSLGVIVTGLFVVVGFATIEPLFTLLGASDAVMPYIKEYMRIWYAGVIFVVIPMVGNNSMRALGDTKTPGIVMMIAAVVNTALDPIFIFGCGAIPAMGVAGAAFATVLSRMTTFGVAIYVLVWRDGIVSFRNLTIKRTLASWKKILYIGIPNALTRVIQPVGIGIITGILSTYGIGAVAGFGVAAKFERFVLIAVMALSVVMTPFVGQNYGAGRLDRVRQGMKLSYRFSIVSMLLLYILLALSAGKLAGLFSDDPNVVSVIVLYLRLVPLGYGAYGVLRISVSVMNALHKPFKAAVVMMGQLFVVYIPLALLGSKMLGLKGVFGALIVSYIVAAVVSWYLATQMTGGGVKDDVCSIDE
jgi:putative MATE family efflux protein